MGTRISIKPPADYVLARDVCSYGYFLLAPNHWDVRRQTLTRIFSLAEGPAKGVMSQPQRAGSAISLMMDRAIARAERRELLRQVTRMLRLDEDESHACAFHAKDPRWKPSGRSRLFRSPTLFEDVIKTVTSCNVAWPSTVAMNTKLCIHFGKAGAFPLASTLARTRPASLRARCSVGYRDQRIVDLAKLFVKDTKNAGTPRIDGPRGMIDSEWFEDPATTDDAVFNALVELPGIGPYAAANIMQLMGRYARLPLDTESVRHGKAVLAMKGTDAQIMKRLHVHYAPFADQAFRSYWFELWQFYEAKRGEAHTWERETTGKTFTASKL